MSIQKRGRGRYLVRWPGFKSVVLPSREAAEQLELHYKLSARLGELYEDAETTLGEEIESYIAWKETAGDIRPRTLEYLNRSAAFWKPHRGKRCSQLRRAELEDAIVERARNHPRSAKNELELLKAVLRRAHERGQRIDGRILRIPAIRHTAREGIALTAEELHELASWFPESHKRLVLLAGTVGARQNEWFTLDERSLELDGAEPVMRVPRIHNKSRHPKAIPLTMREALLLKEQLLARKAGTSLVFPNDKGAQWNRHRFRDEVWQPAVEAAGYDSLPFHMLRHTAISLMCRAGYRPEWVAERVGHSDGGALVLKRYRHLYPSESYAAAPSLDALVAEGGKR